MNPRGTCSTCGGRKPLSDFPTDPAAPGGMMTCTTCVRRTAKLAARVEKCRRVAADARALPREPIQLAIRRRLEGSSQLDLARSLGCSPNLIRELLNKRGRLPLDQADRWAVRLDSHLDVLYEAG